MGSATSFVGRYRRSGLEPTINTVLCAKLFLSAFLFGVHEEIGGVVDGFSAHYSTISRIGPCTHRAKKWKGYQLSTKDIEETVLNDAPLIEDENKTDLDPKDMVKFFGRLAEKYIMLDGSAGLCCYSACSDCEYREPGGGYRMADQSAARPKWIPCYEERKFEALGKEHTSKWSQEIFTDGPVVSKEQFVERLKDMTYAPPLGGPYVAASSANIENDNDAIAAERLFDLLVANGKTVLTKHRMSTQLKVLSDGEEGLTWAKFQGALSS